MVHGQIPAVQDHKMTIQLNFRKKHLMKFLSLFNLVLDKIYNALCGM